LIDNNAFPPRVFNVQTSNRRSGFQWIQVGQCAIALCAAACLPGCPQISTSKTEQRVVSLPADNPEATLKVARQIGESVLAGGLSEDVQKKFPKLTNQQAVGIFVVGHETLFEGKKTVFLETGIQYMHDLPEASAIADYCESRVSDAVAARFAPKKRAAR
jgi:hypothetical protein